MISNVTEEVEDQIDEFFITDLGRVFHMECTWSVRSPSGSASYANLRGIALAHLRKGCPDVWD